MFAMVPVQMTVLIFRPAAERLTSDLYLLVQQQRQCFASETLIISRSGLFRTAQIKHQDYHFQKSSLSVAVASDTDAKCFDSQLQFCPLGLRRGQRSVFTERITFNTGVLAHTHTGGERGPVPCCAVVLWNSGLPGCGRD